MANVFANLISDSICKLLNESRSRAIYCSPGITQEVAAQLIAVSKRIGAERVRAILDVSTQSARLGYGEFDGVSLLREAGLEVRQESGLRLSVMIADAVGYAFSLPPLLVEDVTEVKGAHNAIRLEDAQLEALIAAVAPDVPRQARPSPSDSEPNFKPASEFGSASESFSEAKLSPESDAPAAHKSSPEPPPVPPTIEETSATSASPARTPEIGARIATEERISEVRSELERNPPQKFVLARKVNVFNAYIEFVELSLSGTHVLRHTVQLPRELVLATRDSDTQKRVQASFKLVDESSKLGKDAKMLASKVNELRTAYVHPLGTLGAVILRPKRQEFVAKVEGIRKDIEHFKQTARERLAREIESSMDRLVKGLLPILKDNPPRELLDQISGKPSAKVLTQYIHDRLQSVLPDPDDLVGEMKLELAFKGVTYETLTNPDFQRRIRAEFPYEDFEKPFEEFTAAQAEQTEIPL